MLAWAALVVEFLWEILKANGRMMLSLSRNYSDIRPGVVAVPLSIEKDSHIALLASMITLTPGTLTIEVSPDKRVLYVHALYLDDSTVVGIKRGFERRVLALSRGS